MTLEVLTRNRPRTRLWETRRKTITQLGMRNSSRFYGSCKTTKKRRTILKRKLSISKSTTCKAPLLGLFPFANIIPRFKQRFKSLIDQYELRELHFHSLLRSKELEVQYNMARFDREKKAAEAEAARSRALNAQVLTFSKTETELRNQLNIYVEKFKQVRINCVLYPRRFLYTLIHLHLMAS